MGGRSPHHDLENDKPDIYVGPLDGLRQRTRAAQSSTLIDAETCSEVKEKKAHRRQ